MIRVTKDELDVKNPEDKGQALLGRGSVYKIMVTVLVSLR